MKMPSSPWQAQPFLTITAACALSLFACGGEETPTGESGSGETEVVADSGTPDSSGDFKSYGTTLTGAEALTVDALLADRHIYLDQTVEVTGIVVGVCEKRGCWINIGGSDGKAVRFKVNDGEIVFPMSAKGSVVRAEGVWTRNVISVEQLREMEAKHAAEAGEDFDPETITEPIINWQLKGLGAKIDA